jgi:internalin A
LDSLILSNNKVSELKPIAGLTRLTLLYLNGNDVLDIAPLAGMYRLSRLNLSDNMRLGVSEGSDKLQDIAPLSKLTQLMTVDLSNNSVKDLGPLRGLKELKWVNLTGNMIANVEPLLDNDGLGLGDRVMLDRNKLEPESLDKFIPMLSDEGVHVTFSDYREDLIVPSAPKAAAPSSDMAPKETESGGASSAQ